MLIYCNPYTPDAAACMGLPLPTTVNPYQPDALLREAGYLVFTPLSSLDDAAFYVPVAPDHAMAREVYQSRTEDELLTMTAYVGRADPVLAGAPVQPVPEAPMGALLLSALVLGVVWKAAR